METLDCVVSECDSSINFGTCFEEDCFLERTLALDVSNDDVSTSGVIFRVKREGSCVTDAPTSFPTGRPTTERPTGSEAPTPFPTFGCAGTQEVCGGDDNYVGPTCCIADHQCLQPDELEPRMVCIIGASLVLEDESNSSDLIVSVLGILLICGCFIASSFFLRQRSKKDEEIPSELRTNNDMYEGLQKQSEKESTFVEPPVVKESVEIL